jgi:hypothetical protein
MDGHVAAPQRDATCTRRTGRLLTCSAKGDRRRVPKLSDMREALPSTSSICRRTAASQRPLSKSTS